MVRKITLSLSVLLYIYVCMYRLIGRLMVHVTFMITDLHLYLKVVATVAFGMGLDKRDVGAVRKKKLEL